MIDFTGFFTLGHVFTAHVTGNIELAPRKLLAEKRPSRDFAFPRGGWLGRSCRQMPRLRSRAAFVGSIRP